MYVHIYVYMYIYYESIEPQNIYIHTGRLKTRKIMLANVFNKCETYVANSVDNLMFETICYLYFPKC